MKKIILIVFLTLAVTALYSQPTYNKWITVGGNNNRTGYLDTFFDVSPFGFSRTFNAPYSIWGMPIFSYNDRFVTTRYTSLSPLRALIVAFSYSDTNSKWTYGESSGVNIIMGINNNKVYVRDFQQGGNDIIFALNAENGSNVWTSPFTVERGIIWTAVFAANGDLILPGSGTKRIMRINNLNGDTVWTNKRIIPNTGAEGMCINANTLYTWQGGITTPKTILAIDVNTGITKYSSMSLPGDGDQEIPFTVSSNGVVYCIRDGGLMYALKDNGTGFDSLWSRFVTQPVGTYSQIAVGKDSSVYIPFGKKIYRLNHQTGIATDSSIDLVTIGTINPRFAMGKTGNSLYVSNGAAEPSEGKFFIFDQTLHNVSYQASYPYNYYCGPTLGGDELNPFLLMTGGGTEIRSFYTYIDKVKINSSLLPDKFELKQNYPNPFNPVTNLEFGISNLEFVSLKVYDMLGNEVAILVNSELNPGTYSYEFDASGYSSGIYFYKLTAGEYSETRKMNLIK
ncbi:MAG: T9SS type A sorting domain-containing protein [Ignavibacteria bacterium]